MMGKYIYFLMVGCMKQNILYTFCYYTDWSLHFGSVFHFFRHRSIYADYGNCLLLLSLSIHVNLIGIQLFVHA